jgi:DNA-binding FadR family transcriptional regulator
VGILVRIEKGSLAQEVMQKMISGINLGHYPSGSKLPPNDELAKMFGVGRSSIREALKELQTLGIVSLKHGEGTYVCSFSSESQGPMNYVAEFRRMIEVYSIQEGIEKATQEDLQQLQELYDAMKTHIEDDSLFIYYDRQFHYKVAELTRNPMIMSVLKSIEILFAQLQHAVVHLQGQKARALREHKAMLDGFLKRDKEKTLVAANGHFNHILEGWAEVTKAMVVGSK